MPAKERIASIIMDLMLDGLDEPAQVVLQVILESKIPVPHSHLMINLVKSDSPIKTQKQLLDILTGLRRRKIIGRNREHFCYEIHPRLRAAVHLFNPDESPVLDKWKASLLEQWADEDQHFPTERIVPFDVIRRRFDEMHQILMAGSARNAYELFEKGIEDLLRFRSLGQVTAYRQEILESLLKLVDNLEIRSKGIVAPEEHLKIEQKYQPLKIGIHAMLADNEFLQGKVSQAMSRLEKLALPSSPRDYASCYAWLKYGQLAAASANWTLAKDALEKALIESDSRNIFGVSRWSACSLLQLWCGQGFLEPVDVVLDKIRQLFPSSTPDADIEATAVKLAFSKGVGVPEALQPYKEACENRLVLGSVNYQVVILDAEVRGFITETGNASFQERLDQASRAAREHGFDCYVLELDVIRAEYLLRTNQPKASLHAIRLVEQQIRESGWQVLLCRLLLIKAEALCMIGSTLQARDSSEEALDIAGIDSPDCGLITELQRWDRAFQCCQINLLEMLEERQSTLIDEEIPEPLRRTSSSQSSSGITDTRGWTEDQILAKLAEVKTLLDWEATTGSAHK